MAMEINGLNSNQANASKAKSSQKLTGSDVGAKKEAPAADNSRSETVKISAEALALNRVSQQLETDAPVNQEKVEALRAAIADGSYKVDAQSVAKKMLESDTLF